MRSFKSNENIHKKEGGSYYVVSANKASSVTLQSPGNESQRKQKPVSVCDKISIRTAMPVDVGHSALHYMPVHTKVCANMHITRKKHLKIDVFIYHSKLRVLNLKNTGKSTCDFDIDLVLR